MISEDQSLQLVQILAVAVLVGSSLMSRRLNFRTVTRMALAWAAIFALLFLAFGYRDRITAGFHRATAAIGIADQQKSANGEAVILRRDADGHFWANATINGKTLRMLIDSGASITAISDDARRALGLRVDAGFGAVVTTANGPVKVERITIPQMAVEHIIVDKLTVVTSPQFGDNNVLGMNFLDQLQSWTVSGDKMTLLPKAD
ncbi:retropepsin-like aspartic protease family protein [Aquisediminimonas sediminicola]|uniref:retropepsin-like aspartic protease family protein n=1 Tax=Alteraquisediminimonas sediminicola TaxID=2676787 RepID=UPI001C8E7EBD|nr:TIGR02281 family clan AA aspartic protease [Aquisediminimonas sediminicola]